MAVNYLHGFRNHHESEAKNGALVQGQNSPQHVPHGLYAEQLSGSAFTLPRHHNLRSWLYRLHPSVTHGEFQKIHHPNFFSHRFDSSHTSPTQMRWNPMPIPKQKLNFIDGLFTFAGHRDAAIHFYTATESMKNDFFYNTDGELLIVLQHGSLIFHTEFGNIHAAPDEIVVIPRGVYFQVEIIDEMASGYICENFGTPFQLPELGVIGANGLANPRDFHIPTAHYTDQKDHFNIFCKFQGELWQSSIPHCPLNVVAWHGNYYPYKYNLTQFNTINTVSFDHPDPSIFTVLTSPSCTTGVANIDFVIFPERWMVAEHTFRPPYYHRNIMNEFMGLIRGTYDAKENGFVAGGASLHNCMSAHGPDASSHQKATQAELKPEYYGDVLAFMFESKNIWCLTEQARQAHWRQNDYLSCWQGL